MKISGGGNAPSSLGNITKFASPKTAISSVNIRRFELQSYARELLKGERVWLCLHSMAPGKSEVLIVKSEKRRKAHYKNLFVCGSVWSCPVCAARITEQRRGELSTALANTHLQPVLITYTLQHTQGDRLAPLLEDLKDAFRAFKSGKGWQTIASEYAWVGSVRSLEVTHGANGWHPHIHELALLRHHLTDDDVSNLRADLYNRWSNVLVNRSRFASEQHGIDLTRANQRVRDYVAKYGHEPRDTTWTVERELTKAPVKKSKSKAGRTAFQLLSDFGEGDVKAGRLFAEYAYAFKGSQQLVWSKGLRNILGLGDQVSDEEAAEAPQDATVILARLTPDQWKTIRDRHLRGELLDVASEGIEALRGWFVSVGIIIGDETL